MARMLATCDLAVVSETVSLVAMSAFDNPPAIRSSTSRSRKGEAVQPRRCGAGATAAKGGELVSVGVEEQPGHPRRHDGVSGGDDADRVGELVDGDVFEQEAAGAGAQPGEGVLVKIEGRQYEDLRGWGRG